MMMHQLPEGCLSLRTYLNFMKVVGNKDPVASTAGPNGVAANLTICDRWHAWVCEIFIFGKFQCPGQCLHRLGQDATVCPLALIFAALLLCIILYRFF